MVKIAVLIALLTMAWTAPAVAAVVNDCPEDMKEIDAALPKKAPSLSAQDLADVKRWREEGEKLCNAGKHQEGMDTLEKAKLILGI